MDQVNALKAKGNAALAANKFDDAVKLYSEAIAVDGKNHVLYSNRSAVYAKSEKYDLALKDAEMAIQLKSGWGKGYSRKGTALTFLGRYEEAIKAYEEGLKHDPNNAQLKERIGEVRALLNSTQNVNRMGSRLLQTLNVLLGVNLQDVPMDVDPSKPSTPKKSTPLKDPAKETVDPNLPPEKKDAKEKSLGNKAYPKDITYFINKAAVYFELKEYKKCIEEGEKGIEIGRENRADFKLIAKAFKRIGDAYKKLNDSYNAKTYYEKSLSEHRTPEIEILLLDVEKMIKDQERKVYIDPVKAEEEKELGNQSFNKGDYAEAVEHYAEAIKRNPDEAKYYSSRAACYTKLDAFYLGLEDCETCLRLDPKFSMGWVRKGKTLHGMQQYEKASVAFQKALELMQIMPNV